MKKAKPILFTGDLVKLTLSGEKTETRRVITPQPDGGLYEPFLRDDGVWEWCGDVDPLDVEVCTFKPPWVDGDRLWMKESFDATGFDLITYRADNVTAYAADEEWCERIYSSDRPYRTGRFCPRWASRATLLAIETWPEQLGDITLDGCIAEGMSYADQQKARASFTGAQFQYDWWRNLWNEKNAKRGYPYEDDLWVLATRFCLEVRP